MEVSLQEILAARENRVALQRKLLETYQKPLLCFTMNIPGPVKLDRDVSIGFSVGCWLLEDALQSAIVHKEIYRHSTGCEGYFVVDMPEKRLKSIAIELEETDPIGRLFDMDVLTPVMPGRQFKNWLPMVPRVELSCESGFQEECQQQGIW